MCLDGKGLQWANNYSKKQCKRILRKVRKAVKDAGMRGPNKQQPKFQYDPSSYALNFDEGCRNLSGGRGEGVGGAFGAKPVTYDLHRNSVVLVYVLILK